MNADGDIVPIVEDDKTGETYVDLLDFMETIKKEISLDGLEGRYPEGEPVPEGNKAVDTWKMDVDHRLRLVEEKQLKIEKKLNQMS